MDATTLYSMAIELNPNVPAYYGNRSFCYLKTEYYGLALADANKAIQLDRKYIKVRVEVINAKKLLSYIVCNSFSHHAALIICLQDSISGFDLINLIDELLDIFVVKDFIKL